MSGKVNDNSSNLVDTLENKARISGRKRRQ